MHKRWLNLQLNFLRMNTLSIIVVFLSQNQFKFKQMNLKNLESLSE